MLILTWEKRQLHTQCSSMVIESSTSQQHIIVTAAMESAVAFASSSLIHGIPNDARHPEKPHRLEARCSKQVVVRTTSRRDDEIHIGPQLPQQQRCKGIAHGGNVPKSSGKLLGTFEMEVLKTGTANPTKKCLFMFKSVFSFPTM